VGGSFRRFQLRCEETRDQVKSVSSQLSERKAGAARGAAGETRVDSGGVEAARGAEVETMAKGGVEAARGAEVETRIEGGVEAAGGAEVKTGVEGGIEAAGVIKGRREEDEREKGTLESLQQESAAQQARNEIVRLTKLVLVHFS
jgi:hypothetical protein